MSILSLARLEDLLDSLKTDTNRPASALPEFELWRQLGHFSRNNVRRGGPLVVRPEHQQAARELIRAIEEAVQKIAGRLNREWRPGPGGVNDGAYRHGDSAWAIGAVTFSVEQFPILRGEAELRKTEPIAAGIPDFVVAFLVTVPGIKDKITRENHGHWGYHYHYLDGKGRRSDTLLTFDSKSVNVTSPNLCWERHAEGDKFKARAGAWGSDKRQSVYSVCHPHASKFGLSAFKRPASNAAIVWP